MSPNKFSVSTTSKLVGAVTRRMAQASTYSVLELHVGILFAEQRDDLAPELRGFENVGFVDRGHFLAALARELKSNAGHALDLLHRIAHGVECRFAIRANESARLAEVQAAEQLAHEHDVGAANDLFFQRRTIRDAWINDCRTKVGESLERLAQAEQAGFDALFGRKVIVFWRSHRAQQNSVAVQAALDGLCRQRCSELIDGYAADRALGEFELVVVQVRHAAQNAHRFPSDFGTDAVAGQDRDLELHAWRQLLNLQCHAERKRD